MHIKFCRIFSAEASCTQLLLCSDVVIELRFLLLTMFCCIADVFFPFFLISISCNIHVVVSLKNCGV